MNRFIPTVLLCLLILPLGTLQAAPVNINQAPAEEIADSLSGIGEKKALDIVEWRKTHGPFESIDQLTEIKGIGPKTVEANREDIRLK